LGNTTGRRNRHALRGEGFLSGEGKKKCETVITVERLKVKKEKRRAPGASTYSQRRVKLREGRRVLRWELTRGKRSTTSVRQRTKKKRVVLIHPQFLGVMSFPRTGSAEERKEGETRGEVAGNRKQQQHRVKRKKRRGKRKKCREGLEMSQ